MVIFEAVWTYQDSPKFEQSIGYLDESHKSTRQSEQ